MGLAVSALSSPRSAPPLHEAYADCMIALLTRIEREECSELEVRGSKRLFSCRMLQASTVATVCTMEASYQLAVTEEDLEKCLNYCRFVQHILEKA